MSLKEISTLNSDLLKQMNNSEDNLKNLKYRMEEINNNLKMKYCERFKFDNVNCDISVTPNPQFQCLESIIFGDRNEYHKCYIYKHMTFQLDSDNVDSAKRVFTNRIEYIKSNLNSEMYTYIISINKFVHYLKIITEKYKYYFKLFNKWEYIDKLKDTEDKVSKELLGDFPNKLNELKKFISELKTKMEEWVKFYNGLNEKSDILKGIKRHIPRDFETINLFSNKEDEIFINLIRLFASPLLGPPIMLMNGITNLSSFLSFESIKRIFDNLKFYDYEDKRYLNVPIDNKKISINNKKLSFSNFEKSINSYQEIDDMETDYEIIVTYINKQLKNLEEIKKNVKTNIEEMKEIKELELDTSKTYSKGFKTYFEGIENKILKNEYKKEPTAKIISNYSPKQLINTLNKLSKSPKKSTLTEIKKEELEETKTQEVKPQEEQKKGGKSRLFPKQKSLKKMIKKESNRKISMSTQRRYYPRATTMRKIQGISKGYKYSRKQSGKN